MDLRGGFPPLKINLLNKLEMHIPKNPLHKAPLLFCLWVTHNLERSEEEPKESTNAATPTSITSLKSLLACPTKNSVQVFKADNSRTKLCDMWESHVTLLTVKRSFSEGQRLGAALLHECVDALWALKEQII